MDILAFAASRDERAVIERALPADFPVRFVDDWIAYRAAAADQSCRLVSISAGAEHTEVGTSSPNFSPLDVDVVVICPGCGDALHTLGIHGAVVLRQDEVHERLWTTVAAIAMRPALTRIEQTVARCAELQPSLRRALTFALRADRPTHSIGALAAAAQCDRSTIAREWRDASHRFELLPKHPSDFLGWILLLRARALYRHDQGWDVVARQLGVHERTLSRLSQRLLGRGLRHLANYSWASVVEAVTKHVLAPLVVPSRRK